MQFYFSPERRKMVLDGVEQSGPAEYLRVGRLVYFGNNDLELVDRPGGRPAPFPGLHGQPDRTAVPGESARL